MNIIQGYKKPTQPNQAQNPELADVRKKLEELEQWKTSSDAEKQELIAEQVRNEYDTRYGKELESQLKTKGIQKLSEIEKQWLRNQVDNEYRQDWEDSQKNNTQPKLGWNELSKITQKYVNAVDSARREALKGSVRKDGSPDAINGGGPSQFSPKPGVETKAQRVDRIASELKQSFNKTI